MLKPKWLKALVSPLQCSTMGSLALMVMSLWLVTGVVSSDSASTIATTDTTTTTNTTTNTTVECKRQLPGVMRMALGVDLARLSLYPTPPPPPPDHATTETSSDTNNATPTMVNDTEDYDIADDDDGFRGAVLQMMACAEGNKYFHRGIDQLFDLPDAISSVIPESDDFQCCQDFRLARSPTELRQQLIGDEVVITSWDDDKEDTDKDEDYHRNGVPRGAFSASATYRAAQRRMLQSNQSLAQIGNVYSMSTMSLAEPPSSVALSPGFKAELASLAAVVSVSGGGFASNPQPYRRLIARYGTHYWTQVRLGGMVQASAFLSDRYLSKFTDHWRANQKVKTVMEEVFVRAFGLHDNIFLTHACTSCSDDDNNDWRNNTGLISISAQYFGGEGVQGWERYRDRVNLSQLSISQQPSQQSKQPLQPPPIESSFPVFKWAKTVHPQPRIAWGRLGPLYELVSNLTLRRELRLATRWHLMQAYLGELQAGFKYSNRTKELERLPLYGETMDLVSRRQVHQLRHILARLDQLHLILDVLTKQKSELTAGLEEMEAVIAYRETIRTRCTGEEKDHKVGEGHFARQLRAHKQAVLGVLSSLECFNSTDAVEALATTVSSARDFVEYHSNTIGEDNCPWNLDKEQMKLCKMCALESLHLEGEPGVTETQQLHYLRQLRRSVLRMLTRYCRELNLWDDTRHQPELVIRCRLVEQANSSL